MNLVNLHIGTLDDMQEMDIKTNFYLRAKY